tara:strand:- start:235 stop:846 length:612 start_codon:yes stop_codon:yes gene_type:complete
VIKVGVLELQGNFESHHKILKKLGYDSVGVKSSNDFDCLDGLVLPGGESTTMSLLIDSFNLRNSLLDFSKNKPILGTCAGLILMAKNIENESKVNPLGILDITIGRNAYGRQIMSKKEKINMEFDSNLIDFEVTLIRAPKIKEIGNETKVLLALDDSPIAIYDGMHMGLSFHPELNGVTIFHDSLFKGLVNSNFDIAENINAA